MFFEILVRSAALHTITPKSARAREKAGVRLESDAGGRGGARTDPVTQTGSQEDSDFHNIENRTLRTARRGGRGDVSMGCAKALEGIGGGQLSSRGASPSGGEPPAPKKFKVDAQ